MAQDFRYKTILVLVRIFQGHVLEVGEGPIMNTSPLPPLFFWVRGERYWVWKTQPAELTPSCTYPTYRYFCLMFQPWYFFDIQTAFRKGRGTRDQIANIHWVIEKAKSSRKTSTSASFTTLKPLTVWITTNCGKFLKRWEYQTTWPASWKICMQVKKQQLELNMEQQTGSRLGKE